jgi:hypothetical protein
MFLLLSCAHKKVTKEWGLNKIWTHHLLVPLKFQNSPDLIGLKQLKFWSFHFAVIRLPNFINDDYYLSITKSLLGELNLMVQREE